MENRYQVLIKKIKALEHELFLEIQRKEQEFSYKITGRKVAFTEETTTRHKRIAMPLWRYIAHTRLLIIITAPMIWGCLLPAILLDLMVNVYQALCFGVYGIPKVLRRNYIVIDRQALKYLNLVEKVNCVYCGYFNGLIAFVQEVAVRTEQYWCPIKHARRVGDIHSRYKNFLEYGDGEHYHEQFNTVRHDFHDLAEEE